MQENFDSHKTLSQGFKNFQNIQEEENKFIRAEIISLKK
jgi:hypothetical protein